MIVWITGEKDKVEERRLAEAIAGAFERSMVLHGEEFAEEFRLREQEGKFNSILVYRLAVVARILEKQDCLVVVAHGTPQTIIQNLRRLYSRSIPVIIDQTVQESVDMPFVHWNKGDRVTDRDHLVEVILRRIKEVSRALDNTKRT